jgi:hypothetical protein
MDPRSEGCSNNEKLDQTAATAIATSETPQTHRRNSRLSAFRERKQDVTRDIGQGDKQDIRRDSKRDIGRQSPGKSWRTEQRRRVFAEQTSGELCKFGEVKAA